MTSPQSAYLTPSPTSSAVPAAPARMSSTGGTFSGVQDALRMLQPMMPTYLHLLVSALIPIYAGAHASLTRPSSAAKPGKSKKKTIQGKDVEDEPEDEVESQIEGLTASDAIWFPLLAGCTLGGLYLIIKWLEDPALLNTILNWYFAIFGIVGVAKIFKDSLDVLVSYVFPARYFYEDQIWEFDEVQKFAASQTDPSRTKQSPLPGRLQYLPLPDLFSRFLWILRSSKSTLCIRTDLHRRGKTHIHFSPTTILSTLLALAIVLYYNLIARPWYLTNILGFAFAYNALQLISPSTSWTGSLILASLFCYDIYFVFFTPLMVTVATKLDIPAKLLFPRPASPDSTKQQLSMLGLGDIVLPGMMIGFALRLDLYLHYLRKQTTKSLLNPRSDSTSSTDDVQSSPSSNLSSSSIGDLKTPSFTHSASSIPSTEDIQANPTTYASNPSTPGSITVKSPFHPATGNWGTRFWTSNSDPSIQGTLFPKPYFTASMVGYVVGMVLTLGIMQVTGHAQPALFYLVPCVLGAFWGCAVVKGEVKEVWNFDESKGKEDEASKKAGDAVKDAVAGKVKEEAKVEIQGEGKEEESIESNDAVDEDDTKKKAARKGRKIDSSDFFVMDLNIGFTRSKGTKGCGLMKGHASKEGEREQDGSGTHDLEVLDTDEGSEVDVKS
ncbi:MAG: hypothetical protein Q9166_007725 [cf. Caloplaca sp. 2 TL-2023]